MSNLIKIFDAEVERYLLQAGVSQKEINQIKYTTLKQKVVERLNNVLEDIANERFDDFAHHLGYSSSGDGYGDENHYINFGDFISAKGDSRDIQEICEFLKQLKS